MMVEIDEVAVPGQLWNGARDGDKQAIAQLKLVVGGLTTYCHALSVAHDDNIGPWIPVSLRQLEEAGIVEAVTISYVYGTPGSPSVRCEPHNST